MTVSTTAELSLFLHDWGTPVIHQSVQTTYNPATQTATETIVTTPLTAIVGPLVARTAPGTGGHHRDQQRTFLVASNTWPPADTDTLRRLQCDGVSYDILDWQQSEVAGYLTITTRRRD